MTRLRAIPARLLLVSATILALTLLLAFALMRLTQLEPQLTNREGENLLWALTQAQYESQRFLLSAMEWNSGPRDPDSAKTLLQRRDMMLSRLPLLASGRMGQQVDELGFSAKIDTAIRDLDILASKVGYAVDKAVTLPLSEAAAVTALVADTRTIANRLILSERDKAGARGDRLRAAIAEIASSFIGILACGLVLVLSFLLSQTRAARAEKDLRKERDSLRLLIDSSADGIVVFDAQARCIHWNGAMEGLFSRPAEDVIGRRPQDVFPAVFDDVMMQSLRQTLGGNPTFTERELASRRSTIECASFPLRSGGEVLGGVMYVRDVTARVQAQKELSRHRDELELLVTERTRNLRRAEWQLRSAINTAADGFAIFDAEDRLILANPRARKIFPQLAQENEPATSLIGLLEHAVGVAPSIPTPGIENVWSGELHLADGSWLQSTLRRSSDGESVMQLIDITPYKQTTTKLEIALRHEQNMRELYKGFVAMVSHQFRTPLAIIDSGAQRLIRRGKDIAPSEVQQRSQKIRAAALRLAQLIDSTLNAARIDAGQIDFRPRPTDLRKLINDACSRQKEVSVRREFRLDLVSLPKTIDCDPLLMDQVLGNLLSNALKYSPEHETVDVETTVTASDVCVTIRDRGVGIPTDELPQLFERFFRASTAAGVEGTGIGLHLAREIARMHGGDITVESTEGSGSAFTLTLPVHVSRNSRSNHADIAF